MSRPVEEQLGVGAEASCLENWRPARKPLEPKQSDGVLQGQAGEG